MRKIVKIRVRNEQLP